MVLNLVVIKCPDGVSLAQSQKSFDEQGGTIGRGSDNDWVLRDSERFLSSRHCAITCESGQYYLVDTSTNGTYINGTPEPVGKGGAIPLNDGDTIELGDYQFKVALQSDDLGLAASLADAVSQDPGVKKIVNDFLASRAKVQNVGANDGGMAERQPTMQTAAHARIPTEQNAKQLGFMLLQGLGINEKELEKGDLTRIYAAISGLMPVIIEGVLQVLRSRTRFKNEFRIGQTTIQANKNNPLKFSANSEEAITNIFLRKNDAYLSPKQAFQECFDSIDEHQIAIIAGIQTAFKSMMGRFDPEKLEQQFDKQNKGVVLPGTQKNKYWDSYSDYYDAFTKDVENGFQQLFGDDFVKAYEDQVRELVFEKKHKRRQKPEV